MTAQQKIDDAAARRQTELDLIGMELTSLPNISHLTSLQILHVTNNKLHTLPSLPLGLRILQISSNKLQSLPDISHLTSLQVLTAHDNKLQTLPDLPSGLQAMTVYDNCLQTLPDISHLTTLQDLHVINNCLQSLPTLPPNLLGVYLSNNNIHTLPDLSHLTKLYFIDTYCNPITQSHINNINHPLLRDKLIFNQRDIDAFNTAVGLFTNKSTYFSLLPRDVINIINMYISYVPATLI